MLVLSRKKNQSIILDGNISIEVLQIKGNTVRLGINAPKSVRVLRGELKPFGMAGECWWLNFRLRIRIPSFHKRVSLRRFHRKARGRTNPFELARDVDGRILTSPVFPSQLG